MQEYVDEYAERSAASIAIAAGQPLWEMRELRRTQRDYLSAPGGRRLERHQELRGTSLVRSGAAQLRVWHRPLRDVDIRQSRPPPAQMDRAGGSQSEQEHRPTGDVHHRTNWHRQVYLHRFESVTIWPNRKRFSNTWIRWGREVAKRHFVAATRKTTAITVEQG